MSNNIIGVITVSGLVLLFLLIMIGAYSAYSTPTQSIVENIQEDCVETIIEVPVSERITACEKLGGRYTTYYSEYLGRYNESCDIMPIEIEEF